MKKLLFILLISAPLFSCNNGEEQPKDPNDPIVKPVDTTRRDSLPPHPVDTLPFDSNHH